MDINKISDAEKFYSNFANQQSQRVTISNFTYGRAMGFLQNGKYEQAIQDLKQVVAVQPDNVDAYNYMGNAYLKLNKTSEAIATFTLAARLNPAAPDSYNNLANAYLQANNYDAAETQLKRAAQLDPRATYAPYTLGQLYVQTNRFQEAQGLFEQVVKLAPDDPNAHYGLGLAYNKLGRYDDAVPELQQAVSLKKDFAAAYYELGKAYSAQGQKDAAQQQLTTLKDLDLNLYADLQKTIAPPQLVMSLDYLSNFDATLGPGTDVAKLYGALATPNASQEFKMVFQFSQDMDVASVQNPANWTISKANGGAGGVYGNGLVLNPQNEVGTAPLPKMVSYNPLRQQATVFFSITQNAAGNGTTDPSHLVFKFSGTDLDGKTMDPTADEYDGFAGTVF